MAPNLKSILDPNSGVQGKYIRDFVQIEKMVALLKDQGFSISLTQGVYDMFHVGHARYLEAGSKYGDIFIVGVDSDELTRQMKGPNRSFDSFEERIELLGMLSFINIIARRDIDQDKYDLIKVVKPDVLVMSKTTKTFGEDDIAQLTPFCRIEHLEPQASTSTTAKMRRLQLEGAKELSDRLTAAVVTTINDYLVDGSDEKPDGVHPNIEPATPELVRAASGS